MNECTGSRAASSGGFFFESAPQLSPEIISSVCLEPAFKPQSEFYVPTLPKGRIQAPAAGTERRRRSRHKEFVHPPCARCDWQGLPLGQNTVQDSRGEREALQTKTVKEPCYVVVVAWEEWKHVAVA